jgi:hypothetical protein
MGKFLEILLFLFKSINERTGTILTQKYFFPWYVFGAAMGALYGNLLGGSTDSIHLTAFVVNLGIWFNLWIGARNSV